MKFHIVDEDYEVIDSGNNMLELRLVCKGTNDRIGGECQVITNAELISHQADLKVRETMIEELTTYDIDNIQKDLSIGDLSYLAAVLSGDGFTAYRNLTLEQLKVEHNEMLASQEGLTA